MGPDTSVRVAIRIRPLISREIIDLCQICTSVTPGEPQIWIGKEKVFTYDHVFDTDSSQSSIYNACVQSLVQGCFEGYNATVLAYGQTGSGKTYTMGTGFEPTTKFSETDPSTGIVPRAFRNIFEEIERRKLNAAEKNRPIPEFKITAQFLELYNEDILDLLDNEVSRNQIKIVQENGCIQTSGAINKQITSIEEAYECLKLGALSRTTASTKMNSQSSRSHAIFTLSIQQNCVVQYQDSEDVEVNGHSIDTVYAKFHFVDLAGSERLKRTGATGERAKEGISINTGLLCLANVISALGDKSKKSTYIPYRDSKLTRLLQDSLGGNSQTLLIACVSPSEKDFVETLSTLTYANRAKNIKNKIVINHDSSSHTISALKKEIKALQLEILELKQGKRLVAEDGTDYVNDCEQENAMLLNENQSLRHRIKALTEANKRLIDEKCKDTAEREYSSQPDVKDIVQRYLVEIEGLKLKLLEMEAISSKQRKQIKNARLSMGSANFESTPDKALEDAKIEVEKLKRIYNSMNASENGSATLSPSCSPGANESGDDILDEENNVEDDEDLESNEDMSENEINKRELMDLTDVISYKELLIKELEKSQKKMQNLKHHYELKLVQLQEQITQIETERNEVLNKLTQNGNKTEDKARKIQEDYDKKIKILTNNLKKLEQANKEHAIAMRNQAKTEQQLKKLRFEVQDMKQQKVSIMNKMKEQANKHRASEKQSNRCIAQLVKQTRLKDVKIRNLENDLHRSRMLVKRLQGYTTFGMKGLKTRREEFYSFH